MTFIFMVGNYGKGFFGLGDTGMIYELIGSEELALLGWEGCVYALLAGSVLSFLFGLAFLSHSVKRDTRYATVKIGGKKVWQNTVLAFVSYALFFALFIIGCIAAAQVSADGLNTGDGPACFIAFSLIFGLLSGAALLTRFFLGKKHPEFIAEERALADQYAASAQKEENPVAASPAVSGAAVASSASAEEKVKAARDIGTLARRKFAGTMFAFSALCPLVGLIGMFVALGKKSRNWNPAQLERDKKGITTRIALCAVFGTMCFMYGIVIRLVAIPNLINEGFIGTMLTIVDIYLLSGGALCYVGIFVCSTVLPVVRRLALQFYGKPDPNCAIDPVILPVQEVYEAEELAKRGAISAKKHGADAVLLSAVAVALAAIVVIGVLIGGLLVHSFPEGKVDSVEMGASRYEVERLLGNPDKPEDTDNAEEEERKYYYWYSDSYMDLYNQSKDLEKQMEDAILKGDDAKLLELTVEAAKLEADAAGLEYKYIRVHFRDGSVDEVILDTGAVLGESVQEKSVKEVKLSKASFTAEEWIKYVQYASESGSVSQRLYAQIYYVDGSYNMAYVPASAFSSAEIGNSDGKVKLTWSNEFGECSVYALISGVTTPPSLNGLTAENDGAYPFIYGSDGWYRSMNVSGSSASFTFTASERLLIDYRYKPASSGTFGIRKISGNTTTDIQRISSYYGTADPVSASVVLNTGDSLCFTFERSSSGSSNAAAFFRIDSATAPQTVHTDGITIDDGFVCESGGWYYSINKADASTSSATLTATENVEISFEYKVSSESSDYLTVEKISSDGSVTQIDRISGTNAVPRTESLTLNAGESIRFTYKKDSSDSEGEDCGYFKIVSASAVS